MHLVLFYAMAPLIGGSSYNPTFKSKWPGSLQDILYSSYDDTANVCGGSTAANSADCVYQIQATLTDLYTNFKQISDLLGTSGSMTNWFLPKVQANGASFDYTLHANYQYLFDTLNALNTLIEGSNSQLAAALGTGGGYVNFHTAVDTATEQKKNLIPLLSALQTLVPILITPYANKVSQLAEKIPDFSTLIEKDSETISTAVANSMVFFQTLASTVVQNFAGNITLLKGEQSDVHTALLQNIGYIQGNLTQDLTNITNWNSEQASFVSTINNAIALATARLRAAETAQFATAMNTENTTLANSVFNPKALAFQTTKTNIQNLASTLVNEALTNTSRVITTNQAAMDATIDHLAQLAQYYRDTIANISSNITLTASTTLADISSQMVVANATQTAWQAQMNGKLGNIAKTLSGVAAAAAAQDAVTQSLAIQVMQKFDSMIRTLRRAMNHANSIYSDALSGGGSVTGDVSTGTVNAVEGSYASGTAQVTTDTGDQLTAVSTSTVNMMGSLADMLLSLNKLMTLQKAKMGSSTDSSTSALELVNKVASGNAQDLAQTMSDISAKQRANLVNAQASGMKSASESSSTVGGMVSSVGSATFQAVHDAQTMYADSEAASNQQISDMAAQIQASTEAGSHLQDAQNSLSSAATSTVGILKANATALRGLLDNAVAGMGVALRGAESSAMSELDSLNNSLFWQLQSTATQTNLTVLDLFNAYSSFLNAANRSVYAVPDLSVLSKSSSGSVSLDQLGPLISQVVGSFKSENDALNLAMLANETAAINNFSAIVLAARNADLANVDSLVSTMGNSTQVTNIADVQTTSKSKFDTAISAAYSTLGDVSKVAASVQGVSIQGGALNESMIQLRSDVNSSLSSATSQAQADSTIAVQTVQNETYLGLNASQALNALILRTQAELNALNRSMMAQIANTTSAVDLNSVVDRLNQFLDAVIAQQGQYFNITSRQAALRAGIVTEQQADLQLLRADEKTELIAGKADYANRQSNVLKVADQLTRTIGDLASSSGANVSSLLANLASIRGISDGLSDSLQSYVSTAASRMRAETNLAAQQLEHLATGNVMTRSLAASAIGGSMVQSMNGFNASSRTFANLASFSRGGLVGVGQMVHDLSTAQSLQLQILINQVEAGKVTLQEALANAAKLSMADLSSVGDVASAFATIVYEYIALSAQTYSDAESVIDSFKASASDTIKEYGAALEESLRSVTSLVSLGQTVSSDMSSEFNSALDSVKGNLTVEMGIDSEEAVAVGNTTSFITGLIDNATAEFASIADMENKAAKSLTQWAQINIHDFLSNVAPTGTLLDVDSQNLVW